MEKIRCFNDQTGGIYGYHFALKCSPSETISKLTAVHAKNINTFSFYFQHQQHIIT
jgi:hypothetical protein